MLSGIAFANHLDLVASHWDTSQPSCLSSLASAFWFWLGGNSADDEYLRSDERAFSNRLLALVKPAVDWRASKISLALP